MRIAIEISLYPLDADFIPPIQDFIERLNTHPELDVTTNAMSTQIAGDITAIFDVLSREMRTTFEQTGRKVFVMKVLGGEAR